MDSSLESDIEKVAVAICSKDGDCSCARFGGIDVCYSRILHGEEARAAVMALRPSGGFDIAKANSRVEEVRNAVWGRVWRHKKRGTTYGVGYVSIDESTGDVMVSYRDLRSGLQWTRKADLFLDGRYEVVEDKRNG